MRILWLSWKDIHHPQAGGAEVVSAELMKRLVKDGHDVLLVTAAYPGALATDTIDGYKVVRKGGRFSVYWHAYRHVKKELADWPEYVIEEVNTIPFFSRLYLPRLPRKMFFHMLCREIWFYQLPAPLGAVGYVAEPVYLRFLSREQAIAMSDSTKQDLLRYGFADEQTSVISEGIELEPIRSLPQKYTHDAPTIVSLGSMRAMKRTADQVRAFEIAKESMPSLRMKIAGDGNGRYGEKVLAMIASSPYGYDIEYLGRISKKEKIALLKKSHLITVTSVKEGWGLIVTEAASQGTPAVVYDVDGLRDSVRNGKTGVVCRANTPTDLAQHIVAVLSDESYYQLLRKNAWQWSKSINFETCYQQFNKELQS